MYAVISTGGKQYRVEEGQTLDVELLGDVGASVEIPAVMIVDGDEVRATPDELASATMTVEVIDRVRGPKINGFTYKPKSNQRRRWGHRQNYNTIKITGISKG